MQQIFKRGLIAIAPLALTIAIIIWFFNFLESTFGKPVEALVGPEHYFPGMGILVAIVVLFVIGSILNTWLISKILEKGELLIQKIPLVKSLYSAISDAMNFLKGPKDRKSQKVVKVKFDDVELLGLVTRESFDDLKDLGSDESVCVFFPMSYQIGGYTLILPKSKLTPVNMTVEKAMQFLITAGAKNNSKE